MADQLIALLGRRERPTDGVADYCGFLSQALSKRGVKMETVHVEWEEHGWRVALRNLRRRRGEWHSSWVVAHYTGMAWSRRGFPLGLPMVLANLRRGGARCGVVFHEAARQPSGPRLRDKLRGACQDWVIRRAFRSADKAIFTVPIENLAWVPRNSSKAVYIPIGANIPERLCPRDSANEQRHSQKTVAVFCLSQNSNLALEIADLSRAAERVCESAGPTRFVIMGKGTGEARPEIERALAGKGVGVNVLGRVAADQVADTLANADVLLYVYGHVSQTRGSALAGVACGLPIVGYSGAIREPICDAGVELVPYRDREALAAALVRVLNDDALRAALRRKSRDAQQRQFSWDSIAQKYIEALDLKSHVTEPLSRAPSANQMPHPTE
jgi:glycosyltransferase involved in cell wall biosynthesis